MLYKELEKIIRENAFEQEKKKPGLEFNSVVAPFGLRTTGPRMVKQRVAWENSPISRCHHSVGFPRKQKFHNVEASLTSSE